MAGSKPKKIVVATDDKKKFSQPGAIEALRAISEKMEWSLGFTVWAASEVVKPRMPADVTLAEIEAATSEILARGKREKSEKDGGEKRVANDDRLPLNDEAQRNWDPPIQRWKGLFTIRDVQQRFSAEIKDGVDLTTSMLDALAAERKAEKARVVELVGEHDDPDSKPVACGSPVHSGDKEFQPTVAFRLERDANNVLVRRKHDQGDEYMEIGNFLVSEEDGIRIPYCKNCREAARAMVREAKEKADALRRLLITASAEEKPKLQKALEEAEELGSTKLTFYTAAGAKRKLDAMKKSAESNSALAAQLKSAGARTFGGSYGTRKNKKDWRTSRGKK